MKGYQIRPVKPYMKYRDRIGPRRIAQLEALILSTSFSSKQLAEEMGVTHGTAKQYCRILYERRGAANRIDLMHREIERLKKEILWWKNES